MRTCREESLLPVNAYPPFAILAFFPLSSLSYSDACDIWILGSLALLVLAVALIVNEVWRDRPVSWRAAIGLFILLALWGSASLKHDVEAANVGSLLLVLVAGTWTAERRGLTSLTGLCAALAFSIKLFPGLLFVYLLARSSGVRMGLNLGGHPSDGVTRGVRPE